MKITIDKSINRAQAVFLQIYELMCCEFMWIQNELVKCKLHVNDCYKTFMTWLL